MVSGTRYSDRMFSIIGLAPQTSYTFEVQAIISNLLLYGVPTTIDVSTTAPQSKLVIEILRDNNVSWNTFSRLRFSPYWYYLS